MTVPALTVNKVCLSGLNAIAMADQLIGGGEFEIVVAGGMESMTNGPYLLQKARGGYRYGDSTLIDATAHDALFCTFDHRGMGESTDVYSATKGITRAEQDDYAAMSHDRATAARKNGRYDEEMAPVPVPQQVTRCWSPRTRGCAPAPPPSLGEATPCLRPRRHGDRRDDSSRRRGRGGRHEPVQSRTAGTSGPGRDRRPGTVAGPDASLLSQPANAITSAGPKCCLSADASISSRSTRHSPRWLSSRIACVTWLFGPAVVNVNGGAIAMGHPVGRPAPRLALHVPTGGGPLPAAVDPAHTFEGTWTWRHPGRWLGPRLCGRRPARRRGDHRGYSGQGSRPAPRPPKPGTSRGRDCNDQRG